MGFFTVTKAKLESVKHEKDDIYTYSFRPEKPLKHAAGQHALLHVPGSRMPKPFSISSSPDDDLVDITTHARKESSYKQALHALKPGATVKLRGPVFKFTFNGAQKDVVMVAMGVGITPFRSMLRYADAHNLDHSITLIHSDGDNPLFGEESSKLATTSIFPGGRSEFDSALRQAIDTKKDASYYISGSPSFISEVKEKLTSNGISKKQMKMDKFVGYKA